MSVWLQFALCLVAIGMAGYRLSLYGDMIAEKLELSRTWIGVVMVASVTSLPELVTGVSSVSVAQTPDIAAGDVFGSCVFNLLLIVILDFLHRQESVYTRAHTGHTLSAGFGVILIGFVGMNLLMAQQGMVPAIGHGVAAQVVVAAGIWLPFVGKALAAEMGWGEGLRVMAFARRRLATLPDAPSPDNLETGLAGLALSSVVFLAVEAEKWLIRRGRLYGEPAKK